MCFQDRWAGPAHRAPAWRGARPPVRGVGFPGRVSVPGPLVGCGGTVLAEAGEDGCGRANLNPGLLDLVLGPVPRSKSRSLHGPEPKRWCLASALRLVEMKLTDVNGVGQSAAGKLAGAGIESVGDLAENA